MMATRLAVQPENAALNRLGALTPLDERATEALMFAVRGPRHVRARRDLLTEGQQITDTRLLLSGWAARTRVLADGRRQLIGVILPGDLIGGYDHERPVALATVSALTDITFCTAPSPAVSPTLARAYALSRALEEKHLLAQIVRVGRYDAQERIADFLLEILERLEVVGLAADGRCEFPLTQEVLADALGLTAVHVNRMIQALRRDHRVVLKGRELSIPDQQALARWVGRTAIAVNID